MQCNPVCKKHSNNEITKIVWSELGVRRMIVAASIYHQNMITAICLISFHQRFECQSETKTLLIR